MVYTKIFQYFKGIVGIHLSSEQVKSATWHMTFISEGSSDICYVDRTFPTEKNRAGDFWKVRCLCCEPVMPKAREVRGF